jgi:hypothetical protein
MIPSLVARHDSSESTEGPRENIKGEDVVERVEGEATAPTASLEEEAGKAPKVLSASDRTRRIILETSQGREIEPARTRRQRGYRSDEQLFRYYLLRDKQNDDANRKRDGSREVKDLWGHHC